jgi:hypothetical protein
MFEITPRNNICKPCVWWMTMPCRHKFIDNTWQANSRKVCEWQARHERIYQNDLQKYHPPNNHNHVSFLVHWRIHNYRPAWRNLKINLHKSYTKNSIIHFIIQFYLFTAISHTCRQGPHCLSDLSGKSDNELTGCWTDRKTNRVEIYKMTHFLSGKNWDSVTKHSLLLVDQCTCGM